MVDKKQNQPKKERELFSTSSINPEYTLTDTSFINAFDINDSKPGDSVDEHSNMEEANEVIANKEIGQQNENG
ncbi:hypothetical protein [Pseudalkalibacillus decolorationis]|uniref:hypothetical protein n=1 Tax=Pseudalkalibacillus decolorationis TaxID=163879 RepID=UPI002148E427|nr:hypothetical protein [Pseudalkalibacillus decolorationis]